MLTEPFIERALVFPRNTVSPRGTFPGSRLHAEAVGLPAFDRGGFLALSLQGSCHEGVRRHRGRCLQPRARPGTAVSFAVGWADLAQARPIELTSMTATGLLRGRDAWADSLPRPRLSADLVADGHEIPVARPAGMKARRPGSEPAGPVGAQGPDPVMRGLSALDPNVQSI